MGRRNLLFTKLGWAVGSWGAVIMSFFGAVFAALTMYWQWHVAGVALGPFIVFAIIALAAAYVIRLPGNGITPSKKAERAIVWSSIAGDWPFSGV